MSFTSNKEDVKYNDKKKVKRSTTEKTYRVLHQEILNLILTTERLLSCWMNKIRNIYLRYIRSSTVSDFCFSCWISKQKANELASCAP